MTTTQTEPTEPTTADLEPTVEMAQSMQDITNYLDAVLFNGELPPVYITLVRNANVTGGYHSPKQWANAKGAELPEIGINANLMAEGDPLTLYNVLIHELIHLDHTFKGIQGRTGYHNKAFANTCKDLGLEIIVGDKDTKPGQTTGQSVATEMLPRGKAWNCVANCPFDLPYYTTHSIDIDDNGTPQKTEPTPTPKQALKNLKPSGKRKKYTCPKCALNLWGRAGANVLCGDCVEKMVEAV